MGALIYVLIVFASLIILFFVEAVTGLHVIWILGIILSYPAFWMLRRSLWLIALAVWGKRIEGQVIAVRGRSDHILKVQYQDEEGELHKAEGTAIYGIMRRNHPPEKVTIYYFQRFPKQISFGWRMLIYWLPLSMIWLVFTILGWIVLTGWGV